jgi:XRE family aerobic/anaerobic benzoate catabolism transcriptional regulator
MTDIGNRMQNEAAAAGGETTTAMIRRLGDRVRKARENNGIPRRVLSERSGVSPRYLAQIEAGEGNISISLLHRVAEALGQTVEGLISENDASARESARVADLFRAASPDTRQAVLRLLAPDSNLETKAHRICLVGLRGAGKSTLGAMLGQALGLTFVELNQEIERQSGMAVEEVIALYGQEGYRRLEAQAVALVASAHQAVVLAVAGGIVEQPETYAALLDRFHTVWLKTSPGEHMARVRAQGDERPMAGNPEAMEQLKSILTSREALYERADGQLDTSGVRVETSLAQLLALVEENGFLA